MKRNIPIIIALIISFSANAEIMADSLKTASAIVNGYFFDKSIPIKQVAPSGSSMAILKDPEGQIVVASYPPEGFTLEDKWIQRAIPAENIRYSEELIRDYEAHRPETTAQYEGILVEVGNPMPKFNDKDVNGNVWDNNKLHGKVFVVNVWQRECGPCRREMPVLSSWMEQYPDVVFLSASRHNEDEIRPIVEQNNFTWTHLLEASDLVRLVGKQGFPLTIVVDNEGIVRFAKTGATEDNQSEALSIINNLINQKYVVTLHNETSLQYTY